jgi:hypothetical protein
MIFHNLTNVLSMYIFFSRQHSVASSYLLFFPSCTRLAKEHVVMIVKKASLQNSASLCWKETRWRIMSVHKDCSSNTCVCHKPGIVGHPFGDHWFVPCLTTPWMCRLKSMRLPQSLGATPKPKCTFWSRPRKRHPCIIRRSVEPLPFHLSLHPMIQLGDVSHSLVTCIHLIHRTQLKYSSWCDNTPWKRLYVTGFSTLQVRFRLPSAHSL